MAGQIDQTLFNPDDFFHETHLRVRFRDVDALHHVNHATYLTYMEHARTTYLQGVVGWDGNLSAFGTILARVEVDYHAPLNFNDAIVVQTRVSRLGTKSYDMVYLVRRIENGEKGIIVATGKTLLVAYDYANDTTIPIPDAWRERIFNFERALNATSAN